MPENGSVTTISCYWGWDDYSGTENTKACIWDDDGVYDTGAPGTLLGQSSQVDFTYQSFTNGAWFDYTFSTPVALTSGSAVWLGVVTGGTGGVVRRYRFDGADMSSLYMTVADGLPTVSTFAPAGQDTYYYSIHAAYTVPAPTVTNVNPNSGAVAGGTSVVLTGTNFTGATQVKFGNANAPSFTVDSDTQITVTSPPGIG